METYSAQCHCGAVSLRFNSEILTVVQCHCQNCRQFNGSDYSSWVFTKSQGFELLSGATDTQEYRFGVGSTTHFCRHCGTRVYGENKRHFSGAIGVPLGIVRDWDEALAPQLQVYSEFKADWHSLAQTPPLMKASG